MARNYANILTAIWRDPDWRQLSSDAQRTYMLLLSQSDITAAGVLALTVARWASSAANTTVASIRADLAELELARFVVVDYDHEELLVRTFVKWDGGSTNPKRKPIILRSALEVGSPILRAALATEFVRLGLPTDGLIPDAPPPDRPSDSHPDSHSNGSAPVPDEPAPPERASWDQPTSFRGFAQVNSLSDSHGHTPEDSQPPSDGVVVLQGLYVVQPTTPESALASLAPAASVAQRSKVITDAYYGREPMSNWVAVNKIVRRAMGDGRWTDPQIHDALQRLADDGRSVTLDTLRIELTGPPAARASPATSDLRAAQAKAAGEAVQARIDARAVEAS